MTLIIRSILLYMDFKEESMNALHTAVSMCKRHDAKLHLIYVEDIGFSFPTAGMQNPVQSLAEEINRFQQTNLNTLCAALSRNHLIRCQAHYQNGLPAYNILKTAEDISADLIIIGEGKKAGKILSRDLLAFKLLKKTLRPILSIPEDKRISKFKRVVIPVRPVNNVLEKMKISTNITARNQSLVHIIGVVSNENKLCVSDTKKLVDQCAKMLSHENVSYSYSLHLVNDISKRILETCKDLSADLIVISASAKRNIREFLLGNFTQKIMNAQGVAVLCVRNDDTAFQ